MTRDSSIGSTLGRRSGRGVAKAALAVAVLFTALALLPTAAEAQPFGAWFVLAGDPTHGYIRVPHSGALNPTSEITLEAWVSLGPPGGVGCRSIIGKNYHEAYWVGRCGTTLRSYVTGDGSFKDGGTIPTNQWTHIAVTSDGATRRHYINGELVLSVAEPEPGPLGTSLAELRIGSDVPYQFSPQGAIDEVRLWNVERSQAQVRSTINVVVAAQPGLVARWPLDGNAQDVIGPHDGSVQGSGTGFLTFPVTVLPCARTSTAHCFFDRFSATARFRTGAPGTAEGTAQTVDVDNAGSGLFWFFNANNWEIQAKAINGCGLNNRWWFFSAATTNVFYRLEVFDRHAGVNKVYFNYQGPPAPAVNDTGAFATCP